MDPAICVEPVRAAGEIMKDESFFIAARKNVDYLLNKAPRSANGAIYQLEGSQEIWADSLGMGPHVLVMNGFVDEGFSLYYSIRSKLFDPSRNLYRHKWDDFTGGFNRPCYWGVGNGWALVGAMRMAQSLLVSDQKLCDDISRDFNDLVDSMIPYQREDGLFHDFIDDKDSFVETETAEMFAYTIYKMVRLERLPKTYLAFADHARMGVYGKIDHKGLVLDCAGSPTFDYPGTSPEGQAHFIMMEAAASAAAVRR